MSKPNLKLTEGSIIDFFERQIDMFIEKIRPKEDLREKLDLRYTYKHFAFEIFEIHNISDDADINIKFPIARGRFNINKKTWRLYWQRANGKWYPYERNNSIRDLQQALEMIDRDPDRCFFGVKTG